MAIRWRKQPNETGGYELRDTETNEWIIMVTPLTRGRLDIIGWYWYGIGRNTYNEKLVFRTKNEAKADADKSFKLWRKEK